MTEKRQTSQVYIVRILQHFATKRRNITNFVMLFQAVVKCLSRSKFCSLGNTSINPKTIFINSLMKPDLYSGSLPRRRSYSSITLANNALYVLTVVDIWILQRISFQYCFSIIGQLFSDWFIY
jgi:hypothetical protein